MQTLQRLKEGRIYVSCRLRGTCKHRGCCLAWIVDMETLLTTRGRASFRINNNSTLCAPAAAL